MSISKQLERQQAHHKGMAERDEERVRIRRIIIDTTSRELWELVWAAYNDGTCREELQDKFRAILLKNFPA